MLLDELAGLDSGELAKVGALVRNQDVEQGCERGRVAVVCLVEGGSGRLDTLGVGWCGRSASKTIVARVQIHLRVIRLSRSPTNCCSSIVDMCGVSKGKEKSNKQQRLRDTPLGGNVERKSHVACPSVIFCRRRPKRSRVLRFTFRDTAPIRRLVHLIKCSRLLE